MKLTIVFIALSFTCFAFSKEAALETIAEAQNPPGASAADKLVVATKSTYVMCKSKSVVRTIRIEKKKNFCVTSYSKNGLESIVGKSTSDNLCQGVFQKIKDNLESANWKCRDITQSRVSTSKD